MTILEISKNGVVTTRPATDKRDTGSLRFFCVPTKKDADGLIVYLCKLTYDGMYYRYWQFDGTVAGIQAVTDAFAAEWKRRQENFV